MGLEVDVAGCLRVLGGDASLSHSRRVGITLMRRNSMRVSTLSEPLPAIARKSRLSQSMPPLTHASETAPDLDGQRQRILATCAATEMGVWAAEVLLCSAKRAAKSLWRVRPRRPGGSELWTLQGGTFTACCRSRRRRT